MDSTGNIPLKNLIAEIIQQTGMEDTPEEYDRIRKKIKRICEKIPYMIDDKVANLWEATQQGNGQQKPRYMFTQVQKSILFSSDKFLEFIQEENRLDDVSYWEWYQNHNEATRRIEAAQADDFDEDTSDAGQGYYVTRQELQRAKVNIMIEALFSVFFTPIDEQQLEEDIYLRRIVNTPVDETAETVAAEKRLLYPEGSYYKRKDK